MSEFSGERSIVIQAPISVVYNYLSDFPRHVEWNHQPTQMTKITAGKVGVGSVFHTKEQSASNSSGFMKLFSPLIVPMFRLMFGLHNYTVAEITNLESNRKINWKAYAPKKKGGNQVESEWELRLESFGGGTKVTQKFHYEFFGKLGDSVKPEKVGPGTGDEVYLNLNRLKAILERETVPEQAANRAVLA